MYFEYYMEITLTQKQLHTGISWTLQTFDEKLTEIAAFLWMGSNSCLPTITDIQLQFLPRHGLCKHIC